MSLLYLDSSALMKLLRAEPQTQALRESIDGADLATCDLALTEVPRAARRAAALEPRLSVEALLRGAEDLFGAIALVPLDRHLLLAAGAFTEPSLRALDAIHLAAAVEISPLDGFVSYDRRQASAARLAGLLTLAPEA